MITLKTITAIMSPAFLMGTVMCCADTPIENTDPLNKEPLWESEKLFTPQVAELSALPHSLEIIPINNNIMMLGYVDEANLSRYVGLNINDGKIAWVSEESTLPYQEHRVTMRYQVQDNNIAYFYASNGVYDGDGNLTGQTTPFYAYDIPTGKRLFRKDYPEKFNGTLTVLKAIDDVFVSLEPEYLNPVTGLEEPRFWISRAPGFEDRDTLTVPFIHAFYFDFNNGVPERAYLNDYELFRDSQGDICLIFIMTEPRENTSDFNKETVLHHINCYNLTRQEWVYQKKPCDGGGSAMPVVEGLYIVGTGGRPQEDFVGFWAYDLETGDEVWYMGHKEFNTDLDLAFGYRGYDPDSGTIVINSTGYIYGIDASEGNLLWRSKGIGNVTSPILFHHGVAYAVSAGGAVYAHDVMTGDRLMRAACPSEGREVDGRRLPGFNTNIGMHITEEGKAILFARNYMYAYAFEGVR